MNFRAITDDELDKLFAVWDHKVNIQCEKNRFPACITAPSLSLSKFRTINKLLYNEVCGSSQFTQMEYTHNIINHLTKLPLLLSLRLSFQ